MDRLEIIEAIVARMGAAIALGFDWPTEDISLASTDDLRLFLGEVESFLYFEEV